MQHSKKEEKYCVAIESSCDDTGIACLSLSGEVIFNEKISQTDIHKEYGGVVPEVASRNHITSLQKLSTHLSGIDKARISFVTATTGPGLVGGLISGMMFAKGLADKLDVPFYETNHLEGHIFSSFIDNLSALPSFPFLSLLVSGGHCQIILVKDFNKYEIVSNTVDDAAGEAFDKIGRMLDFEYPAGPEIDRRAQLGNPDLFNFSVPFVKSDRMLMSFSGLKTAVLRTIEKIPKPITEQTKNNLCASVQKTITRALEIRLRYAIEEHVARYKITNLTLAGGVAANSSIRESCSQLAQDYGLNIILPQLKYCTDNAAMIAIIAILKKKHSAHMQHSTEPKPRWGLDKLL